MRYAHQHNNHVRNAMDALQNCYENNSVIPLQRKNYTEITQTHQFEINPNTQTPMMTRGKAHNKKYTWLEVFRTSLTETSSTLGRQMTRFLSLG